ncbi:hypothetical protein EW093_00225 [Thiospirochaeta perfilievii]|uniref:Uncharacterized protein n=1 Tax=Thiospirochaeta perfilievii TaxID=252967 RepID=A0A5C1QAK7_9SPIO|nr:winged-helix domain-containing protein [Thiospirochaeta perfilievii]QEN03192.1 hypothetical protein EW093_00225 [Thiospirochaeta perfilievii]
MQKQIKIPLPTLKRYSKYLMVLESISDTWVSTTLLNLYTDSLPITIRKDLAYLSIKGTPQKGYPRVKLIKKIEKIIRGETTRDLILIGSWGLGDIILKQPKIYLKEYNLRVCFDYVDNKIDGLIPIYPMERLKDLIPRLGIKTAIFSINSDKSDKVLSILKETGIKGIININQSIISVDDSVKIINYSLINSVHELIGHIES